MSTRIRLHDAARYNNLQVAEKILAENNTDINQVDDSGRTALWCAANEGHEQMVKLLISSGADLDKDAVTLWTPLCRTLLRGHEKVAALLIDGGADVNKANYGTKTAPLHCAASGNYEKVATMLISAGADPNQVDMNGCISLHCAAFYGHERLAALLIDAGANLNHADRFGRTPLNCAVLDGHIKVVKLLVNAGADLKPPAKHCPTSDWLSRYHTALKMHPPINAVLQQGMRKQEHCRLVSLAALLSPFDLPVLVVYKIYCTSPLYKESTVTRFDAWRTLTEIKQCEKF